MLKQSNIIRIIYFIKFFGDALFCGYMSMYFAIFFDTYSWQYGVLLGVIPFCSLVGNFIWGALSKNVKRNLMLIRIVIACELIGILLFTFLGTNFTWLLIFTIFVSLFNSPYFSLQDGLSSSYSKKEQTSYTSIRILGSFGYLVALGIGAALIKVLDYKIIFVISASLYLICLILWMIVKPFEDVNKVQVKKVKFKEVLANKTFLAYFFAYLLIMGSSNVADSYLYARLAIAGITSSGYSLVFAGEILLEVIMMWIIIKFIKEDKYLIVLKISVVFIFLRSFLLGLELPLGALIAVALLRGVGWGSFLSVNLIVVRKIVSNALVTKAISLLTIALALFNGIFTIFGSSIYSRLSLPIFYLLLSGMSIIGIIILYLIKFKFLEEDKGLEEC